MLNPTSHSNVATASHMPCKIFPNEFQGRRTEKGLVHLGTSWYPIWSILKPSYWTRHECSTSLFWLIWLLILLFDCHSGWRRRTRRMPRIRMMKRRLSMTQWLNDSPHLSTLHKIHKCSKICFASEPQPPGGNFCVQWTLIRQRRRTVPWLHLR